MRIVIDTNVLFSAVVLGSLVPSQAINVANAIGTIVLPTHITLELDRIVRRKRPNRLSAVTTFLQRFPFVVVETVVILDTVSKTVRDPKDRPILATALHHGCDVLVSGDKDFHALNLTEIEILTPAEFVAKYAPADLDSAIPPSPATPPHSQS